jgi:hypothetical protein
VHVTDILSDFSHFDLGRLPALRHFKLQQRFSTSVANRVILSQLLSIFSSTSGIETLELDITWTYADPGFGEILSSSVAGWSELDELLSSKRFGSLKKFVLRLDLEMMKTRGSWVSLTYNDQERATLECERNSTLPYVNALFPRLRASTNSLEIHLTIY